MHKPNISSDEPARLASLRGLLLLDTPAEGRFGRITRVAQSLFAVPIALASLVDAKHQRFKSCIGFPMRETSRDISFCGHAILGDDLFVVPIAQANERFADNPFVIGEPGIRFYAGSPVKNSDGYTIRTLCIIDTQLRDMGGWAEAIRMRRELNCAY